MEKLFSTILAENTKQLLRRELEEIYVCVRNAGGLSIQLHVLQSHSLC